ncbi:MAG: 1-deoxy-D-xylulose 5-phosphate reductoisomerase [Lysobacteraceae bacterium]|nr:MAG: 1-deoxy-D-xylulose 5-phosphate reductoisomerase [Xanthomonadaceae bacterium]
MINVAILGATGSVGASTLDVMSRHGDKYRLQTVTANTNDQAMAAICQQHRPKLAVMADPAAAQRLRQRLPSDTKTEVLAGSEAVKLAAEQTECQIVMSAIVGAAGLEPTLRAVGNGVKVLIANKEPLVMAGELLMQVAEQNKATVLPVDSEHNAVFQCLPESFKRGQLIDSGVSKVVLTASGGPFRTLDKSAFDAITPEQACAHPNWDMGKKISVDSATLMNKGLELIEARTLFGASAEQLDVIVHPQSIIHSLVEYLDGSVLAQMGNPDMRTPIAHVLGWPHRLESGVTKLNLLDIGRLEFEAPDLKRFPCLGLALQALRSDAVAPIVLNAANEIAVDAFLSGAIGFQQISSVIEQSMQSVNANIPTSIDDVIGIDAEARSMAQALCRRSTT